MGIVFRQYRGADDYWRIDAFLIEHYQPGSADGNWLEPEWEYCHHHGMLDASSLGKIGIWEDDGQIVGVTHYEWRLGEAFFQFHPAYRHLRREMLDYAEQTLYTRSEDGRRVLSAYVDDIDPEFVALLRERGYEHDAGHDRPLAMLAIPDPFPPISVPEGFRLTSLADECDWAKVHRVLWRGFNHPGEPVVTEAELDDRKKMFDTPRARRDLKLAVRAPNGEFASFCGMFYEPSGRYGYVEPVATDPAYRRLGLGRAAVLEGVRRCGALGARVAYVGSDQEFYLALGFRVVYTEQCWTRYLD